jgi:hypothetical protein
MDCADTILYMSTIKCPEFPLEMPIIGRLEASVYTNTFEYSEFSLYIFGIDCSDTCLHLPITDSSVAEDSGLLGCDAVSLCERFPMF